MRLEGKYLCGSCYCDAKDNTSPTDNDNPPDFSLNLHSTLAPDLVYDTENQTSESQGPLQCIFEEPGSCLSDFIEVSTFNSDELYALSWSSGLWQLKIPSSICKFHYAEFVGKYKEGTPTITNRCCDPFECHQQRVKKKLSPVTISLVCVAKEKKLHIVFGNSICYNCIYRIHNFQSDPKNDSTDLSRKPSSSSSSLLTPTLRKEQAADALSEMKVSIINPSRYLAGRIEYGKRKVQEITRDIQ
ncbi:uncharacterized protein LOC127748971 [Frankliniella occidentalis]|uniref:Uncharacterized protein LOC127748971 n=1 Tax=Frankliniella occidentalis TaxID=133901 RepID=A0A9C6U3L5_FRAOC|nr:uncharacterized protein LOC127748971 [Frankliniella occidentalis]